MTRKLEWQQLGQEWILPVHSNKPEHTIQVSQLTMEVFTPFGECLQENEAMEWLQNLLTPLVGKGIRDNRQQYGALTAREYTRTWMTTSTNLAQTYSWLKKAMLQTVSAVYKSSVPFSFLLILEGHGDVVAFFPPKGLRGLLGPDPVYSMGKGQGTPWMSHQLIAGLLLMAVMAS